MADVNRIGFTELSRSDSVQPTEVNIVFVHGLRGHPRHTWEDSRDLTKRRHPKFIKSLFKGKSSVASTELSTNTPHTVQKVFWPRDYLVEDIPQAKIWTYGYNADVIGAFEANSKSSVSQHGQDLANKLERELNNDQPIIFVAHSLGGIIVKDAMFRSEACRSRTRLVIFLGTPHRGSGYAGWGEIASNLARLALLDSHNKVIETLEVNSEILDNIHAQFKIIIERTGMKIHPFQEARGISGMKGLSSKVVDDFSSKLDLSRSIETVESIDANHMQMARCKARSDPQYRDVVGVLKHFIRSGALNSSSQLKQSGLAAVPGIEAQSIPANIQNSKIATGHVRSPYYYIPLRKNHDFIGRATLLDELRERLFAKPDGQRVSLVGLGGVGKTQVALQFAYWVKENKQDYSIFWVPAINEASFQQACTNIVKDLAITKTAADKDPKELLRRHLSFRERGKWLLIVDNADDMSLLFGAADTPSGLYDYLPQSEEGLILFTTRHREVAVAVTRSNIVELREMNGEEAYSLLARLVAPIKSDQETAAHELLKELAYLPLAITQAAAYISTNQAPIPEYLNLLRGTEQDVRDLISREFRDDTRYRDSRNAVATTWLVSFDQIRKSDRVAADLLCFMSRLEPKALPQSILPRLESQARMASAIGTLCAYAFVVRGTGSDMLDMHRLVHLATRIWVQRHGRTVEIIEWATRHLEAVFPYYDYAEHELRRLYLPHALRVLEDEQSTDTIERLYLCIRVGWSLEEEGRIGEAVSCFERGQHLGSSSLSEDHPARLQLQQELASAYQADGQVSKSVKFLERVVAVQEKTLAEDDPSRLSSQLCLASSYLVDDQRDKAVGLLKHVIAVQKKTLAEDDLDRLASQHELARAYLADGKADKAIELLDYIVVILEKTLGEDHPARLASQHELARAHHAHGQVGKAIELLEYVVAIREKTLEKNHRARLASQHELARAYQTRGQVGKAIELLEHVVAVQEQTLEEDHLGRLMSQHELARAYLADGKVDKAIELLEHVVVIEEKTLAEVHPIRLASQHELARAYLANRKVDKAIELLEHVVLVEEQTLEEDHLDRLASQYSLGRAYQADGQVGKAIELLEHVVKVRKTAGRADDRLHVKSEEALRAIRLETRLGS